MRIHQLPQNECFFALLDVPANRGKDARLELLYQFEAVLPQPINTVQVVFSKSINGKVLACGCDKKRVKSYQGQADMLIPESIPDWLGVDSSLALQRQLNLLTGSMRPTSVISRERTTAKLVCFTSVAILLFVLIGVSMRINSIDTQKGIIEQQISAEYDRVLPQASTISQPDAIRFATLLNQTRATRTGKTRIEENDLVSDFANLVEDWPESLGLQTSSLALDNQGIRLQVSGPDDSATTGLIQYFAENPHWAIDTRSTIPRSDRIDLNMSLSRKTPGEPPS